MRPARYVLYTKSSEVLGDSLTGSLEVGVDLELERRDVKGAGITFVLGAALTYESGDAYAIDLPGGPYPGSFSTKGVLVTFGGRIAAGGDGK